MNVTTNKLMTLLSLLFTLLTAPAAFAQKSDTAQVYSDPYVWLPCWEDPDEECERSGFTFEYSMGTEVSSDPDLLAGTPIYGLSFDMGMGAFMNENTALVFSLGAALPVDGSGIGTISAGPDLQLWHLEPVVLELGGRMVGQLSMATDDDDPLADYAEAGVGPHVGVSWAVPLDIEIAAMRFGFDYTPVFTGDEIIHTGGFNMTFQIW